MPSLADLLASLDALRLVESPARLDVTVEEATILDRDDPGTLRAGALVLAVSTAHDGDAALAVVERAAEAGAVAVVFRAADGRLSPGLRDRASRLGLGAARRSGPRPPAAWSASPASPPST